MIDDEATPVDDDPARWPKIVDTLQGQGPTPPASVSQVDLHRLVADLEVLDWQVRPAAAGGWFCWRESGTAFCRGPEDLRALARKAMREFKAECKRAGKGVRAEQKACMAANSIGRLTPTGKARERVDSNAKRDLRTAMKGAFFDALARVLARTTVRRDEGNAS